MEFQKLTGSCTVVVFKSIAMDHLKVVVEAASEKVTTAQLANLISAWIATTRRKPKMNSKLMQKTLNVPKDMIVSDLTGLIQHTAQDTRYVTL